MTDQTTLNRIRATQSIAQDRTRRFGYSGGVPNLLMSTKDSGLDCNPIEGGRLLMFLPGKSGYLGGWDEMKGGYRRLHVDIMPAQFQFMVDKVFHTSEDFGWRNLDELTALPHTFTDGDYIDEAYDYFAVIHPTLHNCPYGLNTKIQTSDPEIGESALVFQHCPTCRLEDLKKSADERIFSSSLDNSILIKLRDSIIEANEAALRHVNSKSQMVLSDIARKMTGTQPGRNTLNTIDRIHLKMMHKAENQTQNTATDMIKTLAKEMAQAMQGAPATPTLSPAEIAEYEAYKTRKAQMARARDAKNKVETVE
jgi:hypothetical protein